jgi:chemotaxis protein MotA
MDFLTILGITLSVGGILVGQVLEGGHISSILQATAALIVIGGTLGAVMVQNTLPIFLSAFKMIVRAFIDPRKPYAEFINSIEAYANLARKQGILALESKTKEVEDLFFKKGLQLVIDGTEPNMIREVMETETVYLEERSQMAAKVFEAAGGYAPTIGLIGAVLGLIHVMENLSDPSQLGAGIAVAFVATVYGVASANIIWLPLAGKLKLKIRLDTILREMVLEGVVSIAKGESPRYIREKLEGFVGGAQ